MKEHLSLNTVMDMGVLGGGSGCRNQMIPFLL